METLNNLNGEQLSLWTSSAVDIPVNHSALLDTEKEQKTHDTYGRTLEKSLNYYDRNTRSWRTWQATLVSDLDLYSETWPRWGFMHDGESWGLNTPGHLIEGVGSGFLLTPLKTDQTLYMSLRDGYSRHHAFGSLSEQLLTLYGLRPSAAFAERLMGWPEMWTDLILQPKQSSPWVPSWVEIMSGSTRGPSVRHKCRRRRA